MAPIKLVLDLKCAFLRRCYTSANKILTSSFGLPYSGYVLSVFPNTSTLCCAGSSNANSKGCPLAGDVINLPLTNTDALMFAFAACSNPGTVF